MEGLTAQDISRQRSLSQMSHVLAGIPEISDMRNKSEERQYAKKKPPPMKGEACKLVGILGLPYAGVAR